MKPQERFSWWSVLLLMAVSCREGATGPTTGAVLSGRILFQSTRPGGTPDLLVMDPDGHNVQTLLGGPATDQSPAASPDGSRVAFSTDRNGNFDIYVMNRDGSGLMRVTGAAPVEPAYDDAPS